jgi:molybdenum cofactor guanylyltransferase
MGTPKADLDWHGCTLLRRAVGIVGRVVDGPVVVVRAHDQQLPPLPPGVEVADDEREGRGPLQGLSAGLKALPDGVEAAYITSCDVPLLVPGFVTQMLALADGYDIALIEIDGFAHPLSAVYRRSVLPQVEELLAKERLRPAFLFDLVRTRRVAPAEMTADPQLRTLRNLNTRDDYERALADAGMTGAN